jgi:hypothetical protein
LIAEKPMKRQSRQYFLQMKEILISPPFVPVEEPTDDLVVRELVNVTLDTIAHKHMGANATLLHIPLDEAHPVMERVYNQQLRPNRGDSTNGGYL